jgi:sugar lactone lactonase YvrE
MRPFPVVVDRVLDLRQTLGESPVWCLREHALYWVDVRGPSLHRYDPVARRHTQWPMPELIGAVVVASSGGLLLALQSGVVRFDPSTGGTEPIVAPESPSFGNRHNDTKADRKGRLWTTTMRDFGAATTGALYRVDRARNVTRMIGDLRVPNALAWSPDDRVMYLADTSDARLRAYDFDGDAGSLANMRILVDEGVLPGAPDGATVDAQGCVWSARYRGGCVARITPDGKVDRVVELPITQVTSCAFGDADLRTLYCTTARQRLTDAEIAGQPSAGALFAVRLDVGGLPEPECRL